MKLLLLALATFLFELPVMSQAVGRIECPTNDDFEDESVYPLGNKGLLVQTRSKDADDGKRTVKSELYSTDMKLLGTETFSIPKKMTDECSDYVDGVNYSVWRDRDDNLKVLAFDTKTNKTSVYNAMFKSKFSIRWPSFGSGCMVCLPLPTKRQRH